MERIYLSPPDMTQTERRALLTAFDANWVAPVGPQLAEFETAFARRHGAQHAVAVSSGTAGLHLALLLSGVNQGDVVVVPTFTFAATANAVTYCGATPVFVDSETNTWNIDPALLKRTIVEAERRGDSVGAVVSVDLYGQCCDYDPIREICLEHDVPLIEDAAEAVGASWQGSPAGSFGEIGVFSFNGNKIMTTGGGGMIVTNDEATAERARYLATQAREPVLHYEHAEIGFNYRMSNLLAAIGLGQLDRLEDMMTRRAAIRSAYVAGLSELPGVGFNPIDDRGQANHWLTVMVLDDEATATPLEVIAALERANIEARPAWKPMHQQPVFASAPVVATNVADEVFARGVCLPSGSSMTDTDLDRVITVATGVLS